MRRRPPKPEPRCSFCGRNTSQVDKIITGPSVYICNECVRLCNEVLAENKKQSTPWDTGQIPKPPEIKTFLDEYVIGQEQVKKLLSVAVYNHYKRIRSGVDLDSVELEKSNILLIGPTGTGKTLLAQTLAKVLKVPFSIADATILTEAGYVGEDVENILVGLLQAADYDVARAEKGILYLDEVDKIARKNATPSVSRDVSGEGVQQALLKLLEGTVANIPPKGGRKHPEQPMIQINTRNILFICGGAFEGLDRFISQRVGRRTMGFGSGNAVPQADTPGEVLPLVQPEDLLAFGLIPELVGRLPMVTTLDPLSKDDLFKILIEPRNALIRQTQRLFEMDGVKVEFTEEALRKVVELTIRKGTGARGLRSVLEQAMMDIMYDVPSQEGLRQITVTAEVIAQGVEQASDEDEDEGEDQSRRWRA
ncbi:MAG: ATP-dependent Clp protease ATP-binding subunit ClpX [Candidatus Latescibacteria bacterium]|nr:ATP-dependent Clp protease ATP-binding subunit ClpX [Candidatus Latescibacterota bacterium]